MSWALQKYMARPNLSATPRKPRESIFIKNIRARIKANMDTRIIVEGPAGIGKSYLGLRLGELLDEKFIKTPLKAVKEQVFFSASDFMSAIQTQPSKSVLIYDEAGQTWHHREFMSEANLILSKTMIGYRFKRFITILCVPTIDMIDKDARSLAQFLVNVTKHGRAEVYQTVTNKFGGPLWYKNIVDNLNISMPAVKLRHGYEKKKRETQNEFYEKWGKQLRDSEAPKETNADIVETIKSNPALYMKDDHLSVPKLVGHFNIGRDRAQGIRARYESQNPD